MANLINW